MTEVATNRALSWYAAQHNTESQGDSELIALAGDLPNDSGDAAMDLVFAIERQTSENCGAPAGRKNRALLLLSREYEGN